MEKGFGNWSSYQLAGCGSPNLNMLYKPLSPGQQNLTRNAITAKDQICYDSKIIGSCENPKVPPSECFQKRFIVFDQIGNYRRTLLSPEFNSSYNRRTCLLGTILTDDDEHVMDPRDDSGNSYNNNHEDTEEIDALLYSDDEEASTGRSPEQEQFEKGEEEEVVSSAGYTKKIKLSDDSRVLKRNFDDEDDAESSFFPSGSMLGQKRLRRNERIRETVSILQGLIPDGQSIKDAVMVLDEAISYLKSLKHEAKVLGLDML
ncbi:transcription factor bHLH145-like [Impatiens glandulifera]|uniref:transcription factor bHLH145-like n=1 Tax=Impatiens glandulifera TaxID=253017 RepID=UPI001FB17E08|nr:transcription factor bHLH145-like [Impatiens glandulifera]